MIYTLNKRQLIWTSILFTIIFIYSGSACVWIVYVMGYHLVEKGIEFTLPTVYVFVELVIFGFGTLYFLIGCVGCAVLWRDQRLSLTLSPEGLEFVSPALRQPLVIGWASVDSLSWTEGPPRRGTRRKAIGMRLIRNDCCVAETRYAWPLAAIYIMYIIERTQLYSPLERGNVLYLPLFHIDQRGTDIIAEARSLHEAFHARKRQSASDSGANET